MYRNIINTLIEWKDRKKRKPIVLRGARQVGKSYIIRYFGKKYFKNYIEVNLEKETDILSLFQNRDISETIKLLELRYNVTIKQGETLLFLDEIQSTPELYPKLRYFYEEMPDLHIITAGSLLEFLLEEHDFSMPVGRIEYLYLGPILFDEFLLGLKKDRLLEYLNSYSIIDDSSKDKIPLAIHNELMELFKKYIYLGGMPEVIESFVENNESFKNAELVKQSIIQTYQDDFVKYKKKIDYILMTKIYNRLPITVANKVKYSNLDTNERSKDISNILHLFELAKIIYGVKHSSSNGVPLDAETNDKIVKNLFLDVGLLLSMQGLNYNDLDFTETAENQSLSNNGNISEQFVGQHLLYSLEEFIKPKLHYWVREKSSSSAEIDFVIAQNSKIIPIEVKSGKTGSLKSLQRFLLEKKLKFAVRVNSDFPSIIDVENKLTTKEEITYKLLSIPFYMIYRVRELIEDVLENENLQR